MAYYQFTGQVNSSQQLVWVTLMTVADDGSVTITTPSSDDFFVESEGTGKVEIDWNGTVSFSKAPSILLTIAQDSSGGSKATATVLSESQQQAEVETVKSSGDNKNRAFNFLISGTA